MLVSQRPGEKEFEFLKFENAYPQPQDNVHEELSVRQDAFWSYCGPLLQPEVDVLPPSFTDWATSALSGPISDKFTPLLRFANEFLVSKGLENYWITIRGTTNSSEFDRPRWHTDNLFFKTKETISETRSSSSPSWLDSLTSPKKSSLDSSNSSNSSSQAATDWKLCATLLGPSTLFIPPSAQSTARTKQHSAKHSHKTDHSCTSIRCVGCAASVDGVREELASELLQYGYVQASHGECSVFRTGHDTGAVHSEPKTSDGGRVFVNIVPGTEDELKGLAKTWGMEFPRSWWVVTGRKQPKTTSK